MKTILYWFSGTGNSLWAARALAAELGDAEVRPIAHADASASATAERVGFIFPVYAWGPPALVARFLESFDLESVRYSFAVLTYGAHPGSAGRITARILEKKGAKLGGAFGIKMVENYPPMGGAPPPEKQATVLQEAVERLKTIAMTVRKEEAHRLEKENAFLNVVGSFAYRVFAGHLHKTDRKFSVTESCNSCRLCERICPVGDIELVEGRPTWKGHCEQCFACFHWCPQEAILYGARSVRQVRYHHPACQATDLTTEA